MRSYSLRLGGTFLETTQNGHPLLLLRPLYLKDAVAFVDNEGSKLCSNIFHVQSLRLMSIVLQKPVQRQDFSTALLKPSQLTHLQSTLCEVFA